MKITFKKEILKEFNEKKHDFFPTEVHETSLIFNTPCN